MRVALHVGCFAGQDPVHLLDADVEEEHGDEQLRADKPGHEGDEWAGARRFLFPPPPLATVHTHPRHEEEQGASHGDVAGLEAIREQHARVRPRLGP